MGVKLLGWRSYYPERGRKSKHAAAEFTARGTFYVPLNKHQSLKFSYSCGAYIHYGENYDMIAMAWQYSWLGRPK